jgi:hypothetical protein
MSDSHLSSLQARILHILAGQQPPWTLTGGAALVGFHLGHRETRDLDLFWHGLTRLPDLAPIQNALEDAGIEVSVLRRTPTFCTLRAAAGADVVLIDLVADPVPTIEPPEWNDGLGASILVDTPHEILVNKLNALLSRSELRDLVDTKALLELGGDLERALVDAAVKDGGFSPATLAWVLRDLPVAALAQASGHSGDAVAELAAFRDALAERLALLSRPAR